MAKNMLSKEEILKFLRENKKMLKDKFDIDKIILFGSYARDEATPESDIDILIESKTKSFKIQFRLKNFLEEKFKKDVDVAYVDAVRKFAMRFIKEEMIYA